MSFKIDNPKWETYSNPVKYMNSVPQGAISELHGLVGKAANNASELKSILNEFANIIPCKHTKNWGMEFLENDISLFIDAIEKKLEKGRFPVFMDCLAVLIEKGKLNVNDVNEYLDDNNIGYQAEYDVINHRVKWVPEANRIICESMEKVQNSVASISEQAMDEIRRAAISIKDVDDERAIKDALRSCVSALEAIVKELGNADEIREATNNLKSKGVWGKDEIVKEGLSIFNKMHQLYPDLRHGSTTSSTLTLNEAEYWIGRILNYIQYMCEQEKIINQSKDSFCF